MSSVTNQNPAFSSGSRQSSHTEGVVARAIEGQTAKIPSDVFLWTAMGFAGLSLFLHLQKDQENSRFFGQWVSPFLIMGLYNKVVKVGGSDQQSAHRG